MTHDQRITSTNYKTPYRPLIVKVANAVGKAKTKIGMPSRLSKADLLSTASRKEKLDDFGDESFITPFDVLLRAMETEAKLNSFGRFAAKQRLISVLRNRLRLEAVFHRHPEIRDIELPPIVLVTGLQRTGTTKLHRLLAADPDTGFLASYEAINPIPFCEETNRDEKKRIRIAVQSQRALAYLAPDFFAVHPVEALAPEEDVLLLDFAFISTVPESITNVPSYGAWVERHDNLPAYRYMRRLLQVLQWRKPKKRWVLKSPHHLEFLEAFNTVFPGALIVQTHRSPIATLPSFCSMICHGHGVFTDAVDPVDIGRRWLRKTVRMIEKGTAARQNLASERVMDVYYDHLITDTMGQITRIYTAAGFLLTPAAEAVMTKQLSVNVQYKYGLHRYHAEAFGLTETSIREAYSNYINRFML
jgi:hypothetical protein